MNKLPSLVDWILKITFGDVFHLQVIFRLYNIQCGTLDTHPTHKYFGPKEFLLSWPPNSRQLFWMVSLAYRIVVPTHEHALVWEDDIIPIQLDKTHCNTKKANPVQPLWVRADGIMERFSDFHHIIIIKLLHFIK